MQKILLSLRLLLEEAFLSYKSLFSWLEPRAFVMLQLIQPFVEFTFFVLVVSFTLGKEQAPYAAIGNAFRLVSVGTVYGVVTTFRQERYAGTLKFVVGTPTNKILIFSGRAFMHALDALLAFSLSLFYGVLLFGVDLSRAPIGGLLLAVCVTIFSMLAFGTIFGAIGLVVRDINIVMNVAYSLFFFFCGVNFPISYLPSFLQPVGYFLPLTNGLEAGRLLIQGKGLIPVLPLLLREGLIGLIYLIFGLSLFLWMERVARRHATLDLY